MGLCRCQFSPGLVHACSTKTEIGGGGFEGTGGDSFGVVQGFLELSLLLGSVLLYAQEMDPMKVMRVRLRCLEPGLALLGVCRMHQVCGCDTTTVPKF